MVQQTSSSSTAPGSSASSGYRRRYIRPPQPIRFPLSEEMPETNRHLELRTALYQLLKRHLAPRASIGCSQFVYYDPTSAQKRLAPDAFVKLDVPHTTFPCWKTWLRGAPDVAVEVVNDSDEGDEAWETKAERYRAAGIGEVVRFDPDDNDRPLRVWDHIDGDLVERARPDDGAFECACLGLFWVVIPHAEFIRVLRLARDRAGHDLLPTPGDAEHLDLRGLRKETHAREAAERARDEEARRRVAAEQAQERLAAEVAELRRKLEARSGGEAESAPASPRPRRSTTPSPASKKVAKASKKPKR